MTNINLKPVTCAVFLGILLAAGCGGTIDLIKQKGSAGSDSTLSAGVGSVLTGGANSALSGGSSSLLSGGTGSTTAAGAASSGAGGRGADSFPGSVGGAGNPTSGGILDPNRFGVVSRNTCDKDSSPCATDNAITCLVRNTDSKNCGTCGNACSSGEICFAGVCGSPPDACGSEAVLAVPPALASGQWPQVVVIGDWNGDGMTDFAAANANAGTTSVFLGCGSGTFAPRVDYAVTATPGAVDLSSWADLTSCDVNADGKADLVTAGSADPKLVTVLLGVGDGTFVLKGTSGFTNSSGDLACADVSGDGKGDVAISSSSAQRVSVLLSTGDGTLKTSVDLSTNNYPYRLAVGDLNEDGRVDLVQGYSAGVQVLLGKGDGTFSELPPQSNGGYATTDLALADLNGDGHLDLGIGDDQPRGVTKHGGLAIMPGAGNGKFGELVTDPFATDILGVAAGDVNSDGKPDLVGRAQSGVRVLFGTAAGGVASQSSPGIATPDHYVAAALGDMDGDGKLDLLGTKTSDNQIYLLLGNGDGTFR